MRRVRVFTIHVGDTTEVKLDVTNTNSIAGDALAQIYIHLRYGTASRPVRQFNGFERIALKPGERKTLTFPLGKEELKYWNLPARRSQGHLIA
jgi:beta-glucosidase